MSLYHRKIKGGNHMKNAKSWSLAVSILLIGMIILFIIGFFPKSIDAHAETNYYSAEQYTENDRLLQPDGTRSNRNIRHFANDVKQSGINRSFPELAQVVPRQYLETTEQNAEFAYNGKECCLRTPFTAVIILNA